MSPRKFINQILENKDEAKYFHKVPISLKRQLTEAGSLIQVRIVNLVSE